MWSSDFYDFNVVWKVLSSSDVAHFYHLIFEKVKESGMEDDELANVVQQKQFIKKKTIMHDPTKNKKPKNMSIVTHKRLHNK